MSIETDLARIRAFSSTPDVPSLTPPPRYGVSPLRAAYGPWRLSFDASQWQKRFYPLYCISADRARSWDAECLPTPLADLQAMQEVLVQRGVCAEGESFVVITADGLDHH